MLSIGAGNGGGGRDTESIVGSDRGISAGGAPSRKGIEGVARCVNIFAGSIEELPNSAGVGLDGSCGMLVDEYS